MKRLTTLLLLALTATLLLTACSGKKKPATHYPASEDPYEAVVAFVTKNTAVLDEVAAKLTAEEGLSFYYLTGDNKSTSTVERLVVEQDNLVRRSVEDETLGRLAATGVTGELTCSPSYPNIISFRTHLHKKDSLAGIYFMYCPDEAARKALTEGYFQGASEIITEPITGNWYYVEAR